MQIKRVEKERKNKVSDINEKLKKLKIVIPNPTTIPKATINFKITSFISRQDIH